MRQELFALTFALTVCSTLTSAASADIEKTIVFLKCRAADGTEMKGSGVVVSADGHVLTAKHILGAKRAGDPVPSNTECLGSIGVRRTNPIEDMIVQPLNASVDAALLQFSEPRTYEFMRVCKLENWMIRRKIFVSGFPGQTDTGVPSFREGILSTVRRNPSGVIETDGQAINGMSGGPVFSSNLESIIAIVSGAKFTPTGLVEYYGILPIDQVTAAFSLTQSDKPCYREKRWVDLKPEESEVKADQELKLGVRVDEGVCFLSSVDGQFDSLGDKVSIEVDSNTGEYVLKGVRGQAGQLGASARCIWYE